MVAIAPFRALRYNAELVGSFSRVIAPPYDVISPEEQDHLYDASAYNVVRRSVQSPSSSLCGVGWLKPWRWQSTQDGKNNEENANRSAAYSPTDG